MTNYLLMFVSSALVWYVLSYLLFSVGRLWPRAVWGLFDKLLWLNPVIAWTAPLTALAISEWHRVKRKDRTFLRAPMVAGASVIVVVLAGWVGALAVGLSLGFVGGIVGELLGVIGIDNALGYGLMTIGVGVGFFIGPIVTGLYFGYETVTNFREEWADAKYGADDSSFNFLSFLIEKEILPINVDELSQLATIALRALGALAIVLVALMIVYDAAVLPVLTALYNQPVEQILDQFLTPLIPALAIGLLVAWPVVVFGLYRQSLLPLLNAEQAAYVRRFGLASVVAICLIPFSIMIVSRTSVGTDLAPELAVFWTNRITALVMVGTAALWCVILALTIPASLKEALDLDFSVSLDEFMVLVAVALTAVFTPAWFWAALTGIVLLLIAGGTHLARRIT
jgi:hypothetical protein